MIQENSIIERKCVGKFLYSAIEFPRKRHVHCMCFDYAFPGHKQRYVGRHGFRFATLHVSDSDVRLYDGPGTRIKKITK